MQNDLADLDALRDQVLSWLNL